MELKNKNMREEALREMVEEGTYETMEEARFETRLTLERRARRI